MLATSRRVKWRRVLVRELGKYLLDGGGGRGEAWLWSQKICRRVWVRGKGKERKGRGKPAGQQARSNDSRLGVVAGLATEKIPAASQVDKLGVFLTQTADLIGQRENT